jgi:hypothetical protein
MLSIHVRNWCVCSACASVPDAYAQHALQFLTRMLSMVCRDLFQIWNFYAYAQHTRKKLVRMLSIRVRNWCASVPDAHAQCMHQFLPRMLRVYIMNIWKLRKLMCMLRVRISSWRPRSGCASVPDPYAQRAHKGRSMGVRNSIFLTIFKVPKTSKIFKNLCWRLQMVSKASGEKNYFCPNSKKNPP